MWSSSLARRALVLSALMVLGSCGFALRGAYELPYRSVFVNAPDTSQVAKSLRRELTQGPTTLSKVATEADAQLTIKDERRDRQILSLSGAGRVREYTLRIQVSYQLIDRSGSVIIPTTEIQLSRIFAYDDARIIAKQQEENMLYLDMERDAMSQILRRMTAIRRPA